VEAPSKPNEPEILSSPTKQQRQNGHQLQRAFTERELKQVKVSGATSPYRNFQVKHSMTQHIRKEDDETDIF